MALRRAVASMGRPSSSSVKSCRAALTTEEATTAVARMDNGAALAPSRRNWGMGDLSEERKWAEPPGALLKTARLKTLPGPALPLWSSHENGDRRCTPAPINPLPRTRDDRSPQDQKSV